MSETIAEQVAKVLAEHQSEQLWKPGGWAGDTACSCGWRMGMWSRKDFPDVHRAHVAEQVQRVVDARYAEVWNRGYLSGWDDCHEDENNPLPAGEQHDTPNPYRDAEEGA
jgi:hypothetical protein